MIELLTKTLRSLAFVVAVSLVATGAVAVPVVECFGAVIGAVAPGTGVGDGPGFVS